MDEERHIKSVEEGVRLTRENMTYDAKVFVTVELYPGNLSAVVCS